MGFFKNSFLNEQRVRIKDSIEKFQYRVEDTWYDAIIRSSGVDISKVVFSVEVPPVPERSHVVTGIRMMDTNGNEAAMQELRIERTALQSVLLSFSFPIQEV